MLHRVQGNYAFSIGRIVLLDVVLVFEGFGVIRCKEIIAIELAFKLDIQDGCPNQCENRCDADDRIRPVAQNDGPSTEAIGDAFNIRTSPSQRRCLDDLLLLTVVLRLSRQPLIETRGAGRILLSVASDVAIDVNKDWPKNGAEKEPVKSVRLSRQLLRSKLLVARRRRRSDSAFLLQDGGYA